MQARAADILLGKAGPGDGFTIIYGWFRIHLKIRPLTVRQLIEISREVSQIKDVDSENGMFAEEIRNAGSLHNISRSIAIATGTWWRRIVTKAIERLPLEEIMKLWTAVIRQSDPKVFFSLLILTKGMNKIITPKAGS